MTRCKLILRPPNPKTYGLDLVWAAVTLSEGLRAGTGTWSGSSRWVASGVCL